MQQDRGLPALQVWAPRAGQLELLASGERQNMQPGAQGWWQAVQSPGHGQDYSLLIDGQGPFPDPRSPWQPEGVHGPSRRLDHVCFVWNDQGWQQQPLSSAIVYELHVGTFSPEGSFAGVVSKLDHLLELGVTHIELMPVAEFSGNRGWGYDGVNLFAPHHTYGHPEGLKALVDACHTRGLGVLLDVVYNHLGPEGNYLPWFGPYFTKNYQTPWGAAINFDGPESDQVRRFFLDNALMWLRDYHFDGLRLDAVQAIFDASAVHFLEELAWEVRSLEAELGRHLVLIAESDLNDPRLVRPNQAGGFGLNAKWNEDFHHALHAALSGERQGYYMDFGGLQSLARVLEMGFVYDGCYSHYRRRKHGRPAHDLSGHQLLGYLQNHDQIGNRARGERSSHLLSRGQLMTGAALVLCAPFTPLLFQGEEWGAGTPFYYFTEHEDPDLARSVLQGRLQEFAGFGWQSAEIPDPQDLKTFEDSKLDWQEPELEGHAELLDWHKQLIRLRRSCPALTDGSLYRVQVLWDEDKQWLIMCRGQIRVVCNFAGTGQTVPGPDSEHSRIILASDPEVVFADQGLALPKHAVAVLEVS